MSSGVDRSPAVERAGTNQSVDRALTILRILAKYPDATVGAVAHELEVHKSTASRLLAVLELQGLVTQSSWRGTYSLGFGLVRLAGAVTAQSSFPRAAQQACEELSRSLPETLNVSILDDLAAVNIAQATGNAALYQAHEHVGHRTPLHATSSGKVLLAFADEKTRRAYGRMELERFTDRTITEHSALNEELERVRRCGWAYSHQEWEDRINAVAVPVRNPAGQVLAAMTATGPEHRLPYEVFADIAARLRPAADQLGLQGGI
ncbi:IclR family transcriptional regulator [Arthrobacter sp. ISL-65]|uniref:IclR family transcriptional regulator n=1 Tax=Arthrobacter sp. ISL-65 TaxID=2819112 RepID=UPI001BE56A6C|nr:IclR family transcriptional regulator [Arthrobacter sp. ISL-65]MBT2548825.1 IclR family transcriptional regulator [Arthrobacter sp. ISL-65]